MRLAAKLMAQGPWNPALLTELSIAMRDASICGLGQAAPKSAVMRAKVFSRRTKKAAPAICCA
jgi:formate dehydrogenase